MFKNIYKNKKVVVTGNTGFKGSWLTTWLLKLGAEVIGISKDIPTNPSMYEGLNLRTRIKHYQENLKNLKEIKQIFVQEMPDFIFRLAAQPLVGVSYGNPIETLESNIIGTANILEAARFTKKKVVLVLITSDKAYDNIEQIWGYKENDLLGGKDVYSGSKGAAELVIKSYYNSFFKDRNSKVRIGVCRAGNVIGGGDWAKYRIIVDCIKCWNEKKPVELRSPNATRPWQHVLEPLSGYLLLGMKLSIDDTLQGEAFNFGPASNDDVTVKDLVEKLGSFWNFNDQNSSYIVNDDTPFHEAGLLRLNIEKAMAKLKWRPVLNIEETIKYTGEWYLNYYQSESSTFELTSNQISKYETCAKEINLEWAE